MNQPMRRSMNAALQTANLPPEALALIQEGTPKPIRSVAPAPSTVEEESPNRPRSRKDRLPREKPASIPVQRPVVAMTVRIAKELTDALLRVSVERRLRGQEPHTQQEMVAEAIGEWLERRGNEETE